MFVTEISIPTREEAIRFPRKLFIYPKYWWTRSAGYDAEHVADAFRKPDWADKGMHVANNVYVVRPLLRLAGASVNDVGRKFSFAGKTFEIVSEDLAFCTEDFGQMKYGCSNRYSESPIRDFLEGLLKDAKPEVVL